MVDELQLLVDGTSTVARLMVVAAKTAPKARGIDNLVVKVLERPEELELLARKMEELAQNFGEFFLRDAQNVRASNAVVLIGCKAVSMGLKKPERWLLDADTVCSLVNLGIALGSSVKVASTLNVDNRIMFSVGVAAQELGMVDCDYAFGIPLSTKAKSPYFDRVWPPKK